MLRLLSLISLISAVACGCGGGDEVPLAPTSGVLTYKGKPIAGAEVTFVQEGSSVSSIGRTDSQGNFKLTTYAEGDGAVVGSNRVVVTMRPSAQEGGEYSAAKVTPLDPADKEAAKAAAAKLTEAMQESLKFGDPAVALKEKSKRAASSTKTESLIPAKYADPKKSDLKYTVVASQSNQFKIDLTD